MIRAAAIVLVLLLIGDVVSERLSLPIPGAAIGLVVLAMAFAVRGGPDEGSEALFDFAAPYFPLFFVPAAVGVVASLDILAGAWIEIAIAIVFGTGATLLVTGWITQALLRQVSGEAEA
jgi:holin-like protein